jgi:hypothetical protein
MNILLRPSIWILSLFTFHFFNSDVSAQVYVPPTIRSTAGVFIKPAPTSTTIYAKTTPIFFKASLKFSSKQNFQRQDFQSACLHAQVSMDMGATNFYPLCLLFTSLSGNLDNIIATHDQLIHTFTGLKPPNESTQTLNISHQDKIENYWKNMSTFGTPGDQPYTPTISNLEITYLKTPPPTTIIKRAKRQLLLLAAAAGAVVEYGVSTYLGESTVDTEAMYTDLKNNMFQEHASLIRLRNQQDKFPSLLNNSLNEMSKQFNEILEHQNSDTTNNLNSLYRGELRGFLMMNEMLQEMTRSSEIALYESVMISCRNHILPLLLITPQELTKELLNLRDNLNKLEMSIAIPPGSISKFYDLPLTICHFHPKSQLITIILNVPIRHKLHIPTLAEVISIPFRHNNEMCHINVGYHHVVSINDHPVAVEPAFSQTCVPDQGFCRYREHSGSSSLNLRCLTRLLSGMSIEDTWTTCKYECRPANEQKDLHVINLGQQHFAISNVPPGSHVNCSVVEGTYSHYFANKLAETGTHIVKLPCNCRLHLTGESDVTNSIPCRLSGSLLPTVNLVIPHMWTRMNNSEVIRATTAGEAFSDNKTYPEMTKLLNHNWVETQRTHIEELKFKNFSYYTRSAVQNHSKIFDYLIVAWLVGLSLALFTLSANQNRAALTVLTAGGIPTTNAACLDDQAVMQQLTIIAVLFSVMAVLALIAVTYFIWGTCATCRQRCCRNRCGNDDEDEDDNFDTRHLRQIMQNRQAHLIATEGRTGSGRYISVPSQQFHQCEDIPMFPRLVQ